MASSPVTSWQIDGETMKTVTDFSFLGSKITEDCNVAMKLKDAHPWKKSFADKFPSSQNYGFSNSHV